MTLANLFHYFGLSLEIYSLLYVYKLNSKPSFIGLLIFSLLSIIHFGLVADNIIQRVLITSFVYFLLYGFFSIRLLSSKDSGGMSKLLAWAAMIYALIHIARGIGGVISQEELNMYSTAHLQVITAYIYIIPTFTIPLLLLMIIMREENDQLQELNATKNKLFRIIGHDLRSPIIQMSSFADIIEIKKHNISEEELTKLASSVKDSSIRVSNLLDNLLNWAQSQSGILALKPTKNNLADITEEQIDLYSSNLKQKQITIINTVSDEHHVLCDTHMLNTILRNMISNAIKFSYENGTIEINSTLDDSHCIISIKDNGIGIEKDKIGMVFNIGSDYNRRGTKKEKGSGIGLPLCKEFVEKNNGKIWIDSVIREGTIIYFSLPVV
jgi:signal transduction histidine kinase